MAGGRIGNKSVQRAFEQLVRELLLDRPPVPAGWRVSYEPSKGPGPPRTQIRPASSLAIGVAAYDLARVIDLSR
jgi:hypothetical protein